MHVIFLKPQCEILVTHVLFLVCAGGELRATGQIGRSQTDAGEAGHPTACCQKHVQANGHSA